MTVRGRVDGNDDVDARSAAAGSRRAEARHQGIGDEQILDDPLGELLEAAIEGVAKGGRVLRAPVGVAPLLAGEAVAAIVELGAVGGTYHAYAGPKRDG